LLLAIFSSLANGGGAKSATSSVVATESVPTSTTPEHAALDKAAADKATAAKAATAKAAAAKAAAPQLGQTVRDEEFAFTLTALTWRIAQVSTDVCLTQKAQGQRCRASLNVENIGDEAQTSFASKPIPLRHQRAEVLR
jgi:hypothetical protein